MSIRKGDEFMKVVILAGGFGSRITEESHLKPKPMIEIGDKPILWHIMKYYSSYGFHDFIICLGYKQYIVKEFFSNYFLHTSDITYVNLGKLLEFHKEHGKIASLTTVNIGQAKGILTVEEDGLIKSFREKSENDGAIINGGFMVLNREVFDYIKDDTTVFEQEPLRNLVRDKELMAFYHKGFWQCMDTQREKNKLEELWNSGKAAWRIWD